MLFVCFLNAIHPNARFPHLFSLAPIAFIFKQNFNDKMAKTAAGLYM